MNEDRFQLLVEKYVDGRLSDDEARELLQAPSAFRVRLLDEVAMAGLARVEGGASPDLAPRVQAALRVKSDKDALIARVIGRLPARRSPLRILVGIAALALICAGLMSVEFRAVEAPPAPPVARPPRPVVPIGPEVREAVDRAVAYLEKAELPGARHQGPLPADDLVLLALLNAGVGEESPFFRKLFRKASAAKLTRTYTVSLHAMVLEKLDRVKHRQRLAHCAQFLVDNQCINGQWSYGTSTPAAPRGLEVKRTRDGPLSGNNSCALFAAFGLRACADAGIAVPAETLARGARWWRESRHADPTSTPVVERSGWCYMREESPHRAYASMTAGGLGALVVLDRLAGQDWRLDRAAQAGLRWVDYHFNVVENYGPVEELMAKEMISDTPSPATEYYYYLWALERLGAVCDVPKIGGHDWYAEGVKEILAAQRKDGSWYSGVKRCQPEWDTCFAILFLTRSTRPFGD